MKPETLRYVQRVAIKARHLTTSQLSGAYRSALKGRGADFESVRPYAFGDDVRSIDWKVTARSNELHTKNYTEERQLTILLIVDSSASMRFGSAARHKREVAVDLAALLAFSAVENKDHVGMLLFNSTVGPYFPPDRSQNHVLRLVRELVEQPDAAGATQLNAAALTASRFLKQHAIVFLISDFLNPQTSYRSGLFALREHHEVIAITIYDPLERQLPRAGLMRLRDLETGQSAWADTDSREWRQRFETFTRQQREERNATFQACRIESLEISVTEDPVRALNRFFTSRRRA